MNKLGHAYHVSYLIIAVTMAYRMVLTPMYKTILTSKTERAIMLITIATYRLSITNNRLFQYLRFLKNESNFERYTLKNYLFFYI